MKDVQKLTVLLLMVVAVFASLSTAQAGLVSLYKFDEGSGLTASDSIGSYVATVMSNPTPGWTAGKIGEGALSFSGSDWAETVGNPLNGQRTFSVAWWMKTTQGDKDAGIISSDDNGGARLMIWRHSSAVYANDFVGDLETGNFLNDDQWHHYALTKENGVAWRLYRDGVQIDSSTTSAGFVQGNAPLRFARHGNTADNARWPGTLDDVGLWNEAVSPQQIALISGLGTFSNVAANDPAIDGVLAAFNAGPANSATAGGNSWRYASAAQLNNPAGTIGASGGQPGVDSYIVLDSSGNGVQFNDPAQLATIGAGASIPHEAMDTANTGPRTNVDEGYSHVLSAGKYRATDFSFAFGRNGSVTPFLAKLTGDNQYEVLAVGDTVTVTGSGAMSVVFGGTDFFVLDAPTRIYGGIVNPTGDNPIYLNDGTSPFLTDHSGGAKLVSPVGRVLSGFSNPNLGRTYAFAINVQAVPEPGTLLMALIGLLGLTLIVRRRSRR